MPNFKYRARNSSGTLRDGSIEASSRADAIRQLSTKGLSPIEIKEVASSSGGIEISLVSLKRLSLKDLAMFFKQFAAMANASLMPTEALSVLERQEKNKAFASALRTVIADLAQGLDLSSAFEKHPKFFPSMVVHFIRAGEASGKLESALDALSNQYDRDAKLKAKIVQSMTYPVVVMVVAVLMIEAMLMFVVPKFMESLSNTGTELPVLTQRVVSVSEFSNDYWWAMLAVVAGVYSLSKFLHKTNEAYRLRFDTIVLKLPVIGQLTYKSNLARFCLTLSSLVASGTKTTQALPLAKNVVSNAYIQKGLSDAILVSIREGMAINIALKETGKFPDMMVQMIAVGERTGKIPVMTETLAKNYEEEVFSLAGNLSTALEPLILLGLGGVVGTIVMAMFMPMIAMMNQFG